MDLAENEFIQASHRMQMLREHGHAVAARYDRKRPAWSSVSTQVRKSRFLRSSPRVWRTPPRPISQKSRSHPADWTCPGPSWMQIRTCQICWPTPSATSGGWPRSSVRLVVVPARRPRPERPGQTAGWAAGRVRHHRRPGADFAVLPAADRERARFDAKPPVVARIALPESCRSQCAAP